MSGLGRLGQRSPEDVLQLGGLATHPTAVRAAEDEIRRRRVDRHLQERLHLAGDGDRVRVAALRRIAVPRSRYGDQPGREVRVERPSVQDFTERIVDSEYHSSSPPQEGPLALTLDVAPRLVISYMARSFGARRP